VALLVGGTSGWVLLALFTTAALFLYAVIARIEDPPAPRRPVPIPEPAAAPLVIVVRGRTDLFANWRLGSMVSVELVGEEIWSLPSLEWYRTYAVRIPSGDYELHLFDPRGKGAGNKEVINVTFAPAQRAYVEYRRGKFFIPSGSLRWAPVVPEGVIIDQVINAKREIRR
jgi:hypothetical protein